MKHLMPKSVTLENSTASTSLVGTFGSFKLARRLSEVYPSAKSHEEEVIGENAIDSIAEKDRDRAIEGMGQLFADEPGGTMTSPEYTLVTRDGREFQAEISTAILSETGAPFRALIPQA